MRAATSTACTKHPPMSRPSTAVLLSSSAVCTVKMLAKRPATFGATRALQYASAATASRHVSARKTRWLRAVSGCALHAVLGRWGAGAYLFTVPSRATADWRAWCSSSVRFNCVPGSSAAHSGDCLDRSPSRTLRNDSSMAPNVKPIDSRKLSAKSPYAGEVASARIEARCGPDAQSRPRRKAISPLTPY